MCVPLLSREDPGYNAKSEAIIQLHSIKKKKKCNLKYFWPDLASHRFSPLEKVNIVNTDLKE